jgi:hypothetical protein
MVSRYVPRRRTCYILYPRGGGARGNCLRALASNQLFAMLKRFSSLLLVFVIGSGIMAGSVRWQDEHVCNMAGSEQIADMESMSCCKKNDNHSIDIASGPAEQCCIAIPPETGSSGSTFNLRPPAFRLAVPHPAIESSPLTLPHPNTFFSATNKVFLPNLQASYIRNLALLI